MRVCRTVESKFRNYEKKKEKRQKGEDSDDSDPYEVDLPEKGLIDQVLAPEVNEMECFALG